MKIGTKSLLFGVHQFMLHPALVLLAWLVYYKRFPRLFQLCAIVTHDWGYWGCSNMDGNEGSNHPLRAGKMWRYSKFGRKVMWEIYGHSGSFASVNNFPLSKLFKADKLSMIFLSCFVYLILSSLSGEIIEFMKISGYKKFRTQDKIHWFYGTTHKIMERVYNE